MSLDPVIGNGLNNLGYLCSLSNVKSLFLTLKDKFNDGNPVSLPGYQKWVEKRIAQIDKTRGAITDFLALYNFDVNLCMSNIPQPSGSTPIDHLLDIAKEVLKLNAEIKTLFHNPLVQNHVVARRFIRGLVEEQTEEESTTSELLKKSIQIYSPNPPKYGLDPIDAELEQLV